MKDKFDEIIDPDENIQALAEAMGKPIEEEVTILELLNRARVKVRYLPQSIASSLEFDDGSPLTPPGTRRPKFNFKRWAKEIIPKMNALALKNIQILADLDGERPDASKKEIPLSLISPGEFRRLQDLCFPGAAEDTSDSEDKDTVPYRKGGKGLRSREPAPPSE